MSTETNVYVGTLVACSDERTGDFPGLLICPNNHSKSVGHFFCPECGERTVEGSPQTEKLNMFDEFDGDYMYDELGKIANTDMYAPLGCPGEKYDTNEEERLVDFYTYRLQSQVEKDIVKYTDVLKRYYKTVEVKTGIFTYYT